MGRGVNLQAAPVGSRTSRKAGERALRYVLLQSSGLKPFYAGARWRFGTTRRLAKGFPRSRTESFPIGGSTAVPSMRPEIGDPAVAQCPLSGPAAFAGFWGLSAPGGSRRGGGPQDPSELKYGVARPTPATCIAPRGSCKVSNFLEGDFGGFGDCTSTRRPSSSDCGAWGDSHDRKTLVN